MDPLSNPFAPSASTPPPEFGPGPHRSGDIADTAFTVPLFDEFMRRSMPGDDWRA